jgi:hypothetical protein
LVNSILKSIQSISDDARRVLADPELSRNRQLSASSVSTSNWVFAIQINELINVEENIDALLHCVSRIHRWKLSMQDNDAFAEYEVNWGRRGRLYRHSDSRW